MNADQRRCGIRLDLPLGVGPALGVLCGATGPRVLTPYLSHAPLEEVEVPRLDGMSHKRLKEMWDEEQ